MASPNNFVFLRDPLKLSKALWPDVNYYSRQRELWYSLWHNKYTICVAGNMMGKDFWLARACLVFFLTRWPCHVVTTSVDGTQLEAVLWGEIRAAIQTSVVPLEAHKGGPLLVNHLHIRKVFTHGKNKGETCGLSYLLGRVAAKGEGMLGHHIAETGDGIPRTLFAGDEASGLDDLSIDRAETWADRMCLIGNPYPCANRFLKDSEPDQGGGDQSYEPRRYVPCWEGVALGEEPAGQVESLKRKVVRVACSESPNVRLAEEELNKGITPSSRMLIPGVMSYWKYRERRQSWDKVKQCIQLDAQFYKGSELLLFPPTWLDASARLEAYLGSNPSLSQRRGRALGIDPGEGEAETAWYVVDDYGILEEVAYQTPDTSKIRGQTIQLMRKWNVPPEFVMFDRGGGGKQIADDMRSGGLDVKTVAFGESVSPEPKRGLTSIETRIEQGEEKYAYFNRRAEMYDHLSQLLDPNKPEEGKGPRFCIPGKYQELRRQLAPIPKPYDKEGRLKLPPKNKTNAESKEKTLSEIIGCSPDRADALVVALYARDFARVRNRAGAA